MGGASSPFGAVLVNKNRRWNYLAIESSSWAGQGCSKRPIKQSVKRAQTAVKFPWWDCLAGCWAELLCFPLYQVGRAHWLDFLDGIILVGCPRRACLAFCFPGRAILGGIALAGSSQNPCFPPKRFFFEMLFWQFGDQKRRNVDFWRV